MVTCPSLLVLDGYVVTLVTTFGTAFQSGSVSMDSAQQTAMGASGVQSAVFSDWLDCTYNPADAPVPDIERMLTSVGATTKRPEFGSKAAQVWSIGGGKVQITENSRWVRISASGAALGGLRSEQGAFDEYVRLLAECPVKVTRLDVAVDVEGDAPSMVAALRKRYPAQCKLSHKPVPTNWFGALNADGIETGTWYAGNRAKAEVTACCYDKSFQMWDRFGVLLHPTMRYELRVKGGVSPTLADVLDPAPMFWHYCAGTLLDPPAPVPDWVRGRDLNPWVSSWLPSPPASVMKDRVSESPELRALARLAVDSGPNGRVLLDRLISQELDRQMDQYRCERPSEPPRAAMSSPALVDPERTRTPHTRAELIP